jgi:hypothetical protein
VADWFLPAGTEPASAYGYKATRRTRPMRSSTMGGRLTTATRSTPVPGPGHPLTPADRRCENRSIGAAPTGPHDRLVVAHLAWRQNHSAMAGVPTELRVRRPGEMTQSRPWPAAPGSPTQPVLGSSWLGSEPNTNLCAAALPAAALPRWQPIAQARRGAIEAGTRPERLGLVHCDDERASP